MNTRKYVDERFRTYKALHRELEERLAALEYAVEGQHAHALAVRTAAAAGRRDRQQRSRLRPGAEGTIITRITERDKLAADWAALRWRSGALDAQGKLF